MFPLMYPLELQSLSNLDWKFQAVCSDSEHDFEQRTVQSDGYLVRVVGKTLAHKRYCLVETMSPSSPNGSALF